MEEEEEEEEEEDDYDEEEDEEDDDRPAKKPRHGGFILDEAGKSLPSLLLSSCFLWVGPSRMSGEKGWLWFGGWPTHMGLAPLLSLSTRCGRR